jgi:hypothetical protein
MKSPIQGQAGPRRYLTTTTVSRAGASSLHIIKKATFPQPSQVAHRDSAV